MLARASSGNVDGCVTQEEIVYELEYRRQCAKMRCSLTLLFGPADGSKLLRTGEQLSP